MAVLRVPSEFSTIEAAQNNASEGDTILLAASGEYVMPWSGLTKAVHLKGEQQPDDGTTNNWPRINLRQSKSGTNPQEYSCLAFALATPPQIPTIYVEGIIFANTLRGYSYFTRAFDFLYASGTSGLEIIINRCSWVTIDGYTTNHVVRHQKHNNIVRLRNCYLGNESSYAEMDERDAGELHLERSQINAPPLTFSNSSRAYLDTADWVSESSDGYGAIYGEWLAPWFMAEGTFRYRGTVKVNELAPGVALPVHLIRKDTGLLVQSATCSASTGEFDFNIPAAEAQFQHLVVSPGPDGTRPLSLWPINPELV